MQRDELGDLLARWAHWVVAGNRAGLGYAMVGYQERVGSSFSVDNTPPPVDSAILKIDEHIRSLPPDYYTILYTHYVMPGTAKAKQARLDWSRDRYYEMLTHAQTFVGHLMRGE